MKKICLILTTVLLAVSVGLSAQDISVSGAVTDAGNGEPIPFASVVVKGTMNGVSTDADGKYRISASKDAVLVFSSMGYVMVETPISGRAVVNARLESDQELLDETIVVAYGTATKSSFTGSAAMVKAETIENRVATNVTSALAGTAPGVQMISSSGDPAGNSSAIRIRGIGSMLASSVPLYVVDGMPYDGSVSDINPNDVESISVLKDASASAIYGARGANGVILITTKRSNAQDAIVKFDAKWGSNSRLIPQYDVISDPAQYYETHYRMLFNSKRYAGASAEDAYAYADANIFDENNGGLGYQIYTVPEGEKFIGEDFKLNPNATLGYSDGKYWYVPDDWYKETFHNSFRQEYNLSVSGGKDKFSYYGSVGYLDDGGIVSNSGYKRYTARVNADYQAKKWLKVTTNLSYSHADSQVASYTSTYGSSINVFYIANMIAPIYPLYVRDAETHEIMKDGGRTVYDANQTGFKRASFVGNAVRDNEFNKNQVYSDVLNGKVGAVITPVKGLSLSANVGFMSDNTRANYLGSPFGSASANDGTASVSHDRVFAVNNQYLAEYKTDFGGTKHHFDILAGFEMYKLKVQALSGSNDHLFSPFIGELGNADGTKNKKVTSATTSYMTEGILSRAQYDYDGRYFFSASYRRDASSRFAEGHRWGNFGSVGAAWLISKEQFMTNVDWVNILKLKASYGVQGNDDLGSYFPYADAYTHSYNEDTGEYSKVLSYKGNTDLTWESSHSYNIGVDFDLFNGYLNGSVEVFDRRTTDLLYNREVPLSAGNPTGEYPVNVGSISNLGAEVVLGGNIIRTKDVAWDWNLNLSHYRNKILSLDDNVSEEGIKGSNYIYKVGGSLYDAYMRKYAGVDKETGKALYYYHKTDDEGNEIVDITDNFDLADQFELGSVLPKLYGGFGTSLHAYGLDFSIQFSYQLGGKYYDGTYQALMHTNSGSAGTAWHKDVLKAWTEDNRDTDIPRLDGTSAEGQTAVDRYLISSNYLSINNVTLGYTLPKKWTDKLHIGSLRVYVAGDNLAVFTARKGVDPRYSIGLGSYTTGSGLNSGAYSAMRNITGGITLTF